MDNLNPEGQFRPAWMRVLFDNKGQLDLDTDPDTDQDDGAGADDSGGDDNQSWFEGLDEDLRNNPSVTKFKDPGSMAKSYVELQKMIGKEKLVVPKDDATPEEWNAFYNKLGRPEELTAYETPETELPEEIQMREETVEAFKAKAHELGLTKKQYSELFKLHADMTSTSFNQQLEQAKNIGEQSETELRKEWGAAYDKKVDGAQKVINTFFKGKEMNKAFSVLANDKGFISAMVEISEKIGGDVIGGTPRTTMTPQEAEKEYNAMLTDAEGPLLNELHPEHSAAVDRHTELRRLMEHGK